MSSDNAKLNNKKGDTMQIHYYTNEGVKGYGNEDSILIDTTIISDISMQDIKSFICDKNPALFAVSDGIHVGKYAKIASFKVLEFLQKFTFANVNFKVKNALDFIKASLENYAIKYPRYRNSSATIAGCYIYKNTTTIFNIGDSKIYLYRKNNLKQLSYDHTQANQMLKNSEITQAEYQNRSNFYDTLTGYFSIGENIDTPLHVKSLEVQKDDVLLLCSDGVSDVIEQEAMEVLLSHKGNLHEKANKVKDLVFERAEDNFSFILIRI